MKGVALSTASATGNFFVRYRELYLRLSRYFGGSGNIAAPGGHHVHHAGNVLTQIAFLYFLQDKGWFHIPTAKELDTGNYYDGIIQPLCKRFSFLHNNGTSEISVPNDLLRDHGAGIMDVFDEFHFTTDEEALFKSTTTVIPEMLGEAFENLLDTSERKYKGTFYTPREIVQYMCRECLACYLDDDVSPDQQDEKLFNIKICDPAIGSGAFAVAMLRELVNAQEKLLPYLSKEYLDKKLARLGINHADIEEKYAYTITHHAIRECIYGLDIDAAAIHITRLRLWLSLVKNEKHFREPSPGYKIIQGNALVDLPAGWLHQFDIVIGNPPYGIYQRNKKDELAVIKKISDFNLAKGQKLNAFELFLCLAPRLSKPDTGIISMIFQNSFLCDNSSKLLRQFYLQHKEIIRIDSFPERDDPNKRVFRSAKMSICILFSRNTHVADHTFTLNIWNDRYFEKGTTARIDVDAIFKLDPRHYSIPSVSAEEYKVLQQLSRFDKLSSIAHCYEGEINLTNHKKYLSELKQDGYYEMIKGAAIHRWHLVEKMSQGVQEFVSPGYLDDFAGSSKSRHYQASRLVLQGITGVDEKYRLKFALLQENVFCGNSANYVLFQDPLLALPYLAIFNSELQNWFFKKYSTNSNVNGYEIDNLPVVNLSSKEVKLLTNIAEYLSCIAGRKELYTQYVFFDSLNNAVTYELYFKEEFNNADLSIIHQLDLQPLTGNAEEKQAIIQSAFHRFNNADFKTRLDVLENIPSIRIIRSALSR